MHTDQRLSPRFKIAPDSEVGPIRYALLAWRLNCVMCPEKPLMCTAGSCAQYPAQ